MDTQDGVKAKSEIVCTNSLRRAIRSRGSTRSNCLSKEGFIVMKKCICF